METLGPRSSVKLQSEGLACSILGEGPHSIRVILGIFDSKQCNKAKPCTRLILLVCRFITKMELVA